MKNNKIKTSFVSPRINITGLNLRILFKYAWKINFNTGLRMIFSVAENRFNPADINRLHSHPEQYFTKLNFNG